MKFVELLTIILTPFSPANHLHSDLSDFITKHFFPSRKLSLAKISSRHFRVRRKKKKIFFSASRAKLPLKRGKVVIYFLCCYIHLSWLLFHMLPGQICLLEFLRKFPSKKKVKFNWEIILYWLLFPLFFLFCQNFNIWCIFAQFKAAAKSAHLNRSNIHHPFWCVLIFKLFTGRWEISLPSAIWRAISPERKISIYRQLRNRKREKWNN